MCGIAGMIWRSGPPLRPSALKAMCDIQAHRGPDDAGYLLSGPGTAVVALTEQRFAALMPGLPVWEDQRVQDQLARGSFRVALGQRRLAIRDCSAAGHQPMATPDGRYWIVYTGELYNAAALRARLEARGLRLRGHSDTEVLLHCWAAEGPKLLPALDGMFAFAILDNCTGTLTLARDRFGVKPLYLAHTNERLVFASEIKGLLASGALRAQLDPATLAEYLTFQNVLGSATIYRDISLLPPGSFREVRLDVTLSPSRYFQRCYQQEPAALPDESFGPSAAQVRNCFTAAVHRQLVSDRPVGSYLSGGMDSGSIVGVAAARVPHLKTFTLGMSLQGVAGMESLFDERRPAEALSNHFQSEHYTGLLRPWDLPGLLDKLAWHVDDPRVGMCYQNYHVARLASNMVKVCLSGVGGDELFGGYVWRYAHGVFQDSVAQFEDAYFRYWHRLLPPGQQQAYYSLPVQEQYAGVRERFYQEIGAPATAGRGLSRPELLLQRALAFEFKFFLHGLLIVEDRVSMAHGLEVRVPFLDNRLAELAAGLRPAWKVRLTPGKEGIDPSAHRQQGGKWILREAMRPLLPDWVIREPKQGFSTPEANWYRGPLLNYLREVLLDARSRQRWYLQPGAMERILAEHHEGHCNHRLLLWSLLNLEWLHRHFLDQAMPQPAAAEPTLVAEAVA